MGEGTRHDDTCRRRQWVVSGRWVGVGHAAQVYFETPLPTSPSLLGPEISYPLQLLLSSCGRAEQGTVTAAPWRETCSLLLAGCAPWSALFSVSGQLVRRGCEHSDLLRDLHLQPFLPPIPLPRFLHLLKT